MSVLTTTPCSHLLLLIDLTLSRDFAECDKVGIVDIDILCALWRSKNLRDDAITITQFQVFRVQLNQIRSFASDYDWWLRKKVCRAYSNKGSERYSSMSQLSHLSLIDEHLKLSNLSPDLVLFADEVMDTLGQLLLGREEGKKSQQHLQWASQSLILAGTYTRHETNNTTLKYIFSGKWKH